ncbi:MAG: HAMP domain-containing protein, partial [Acidobacteria bacterium]|nr:HAMP domain-containing protein [Acidobacteriota bacterium]
MTAGTLALAATLGLIIVAIWFVSGRIARPIKRMRSKVNEIAAGDLSTRVDE